MPQIFLILLLLLPLRAAAQMADFSYDPTRVEVDVELALMVDVSRSMTAHELEIQRHGYAAALTSEDVLGVISEGLLGRIAVAYVEWAGPGNHRVVVDWTTIGTPQEAQRVAAVLMDNRPYGMQRTSISAALDYAGRFIAENQYEGLRKVIDVSGDGPNNAGDPVTPARDRVLAQGITINGLPLMTDEGVGSRWTVTDLDAYYRDCVIGGQGAFVVAVHDWAEFASAVRRKLVMEIAGLAPAPAPSARPTGFLPGDLPAARIVPVAGTAPGESYDCLVGEKTWDNFRRAWEP
ncbi:DUF1194 domain-containing protein [Pseudooceanicola sp. CBS1P-1]|uniref:DUF1194 domain-containing protein n=1 Tax=Pseudooceanicola albus TaxID=2692189 RepID=A0A6L7G0K5_9RHOB|nr:MULTISPECIES: DUF1194 domain-containing protein [Pseudooceanicola]MBT9382487.1 DUF1194 domain-containing protein [Pseudooceanicola endophyticus]MXN17028.1 DUF1194 domain-containing protein [Pseudooceanicola albus]